MDPVTVIGLVASIASLVKASKGILGMIKNFKDGDKDLAILAKDVAVFEETLKGFDRVLRSRQVRTTMAYFSCFPCVPSLSSALPLDFIRC